MYLSGVPDYHEGGPVFFLLFQAASTVLQIDAQLALRSLLDQAIPYRRRCAVYLCMSGRTASETD